MLRTDIIRLKKIMIDRGVGKNVALSKESGINRDTIGKVLNGEIQPSSTVMGKLITTLKIPPDEAGKIFFSSNLPNKQENEKEEEH